MSYTRQTFKFHSFVPDVVPEDAPLEVWNDANNVVFRNQETNAVREDMIVFDDVIGGAKTLAYVEPFDTGYWVIANDDRIMATDGTVMYNITPQEWSGHSPDAVWTSCVINGLCVINSSEVGPVYWTGDPAIGCVPLPDWPEGGRCLAMRAHKNFLMSVGMISEGGQRVRWSDAAEAGQIPTEWTPSETNFAGFLDLAPMSSDCVDGRTGRNAFLIYKRESIWSLSFVGGNAVFQARAMFSEAGCAATNAVTSGPADEHIFIGSDGDIHLTDGVTVQSVLDGRAQRFFYEDFSNSAGGVFSCAGLSREKLAVLCFPASGATAGTRALLFDFASGDISFRDMPEVLCMAEGRFLADVGDQNIWDGDAEVWNDDETAWNQFISAASVQDIVMGTASEQMLFWGGKDTLPVRLEKSGLAFGNPQSHKLIARVWPKIRGRNGDVVTFRLGGQSVAGGPVSLSDPVDFVIGSGLPVDAFQQGRFLTLIAESTPAVQPWSLASIDLEFRELGQW